MIEGVDNPAAVIAYVRRLIKAANHTPELAEVQRDPLFLSELINLGKTYGAIDPEASTSGEPFDSFLHTIWTAQSEADIQKGIAQLDRAVEEAKATTPRQLLQFLEFTNNLITIADQASDNLHQTQSAAFFAALMGLGQSYLALQPQTSSDASEPLNFFLDTLLKDQQNRAILKEGGASAETLWQQEQEAVVQAAGEIIPFLRSFNSSYDLNTPEQRIKLMEFGQNLFEMTGQVSALHPQKDNPKFLKDLLEFGMLYDALREDLPENANASFLYSLWRETQISDDTIAEANRFFEALGTAIALEDRTIFALRLLAANEHRVTLEQPSDSALSAMPNLSVQLAQLARAYAALQPEQDVVSVNSFLNTAWIARMPIGQLGLNDSLDLLNRAASELQSFLVGDQMSKGFAPADQPRVLEFVTKLLKAAEMTDQLAGNQKADPALLKSVFIDAGRNFALLQLRIAQPDSSQTLFVDTLWNAAVDDSAGISRGVNELETELGKYRLSIESMGDLGKVALAIDLAIDKLSDEAPEAVGEIIQAIAPLLILGVGVVAIFKLEFVAAAAGFIALAGSVFDTFVAVHAGSEAIEHLNAFYTGAINATDDADIDRAATEFVEFLKDGGEAVGAIASLFTIGQSGWDEMKETLQGFLGFIRAIIGKVSVDEVPGALNALDKILDTLVAANLQDEIKGFYKFIKEADSSQISKTVEAIRRLGLPDNSDVLQMLTPQNSGVIGAILKTDVGPDVVNDLGRLINVYGGNSVETLVEHVKKMSSTGANQSRDIAFTLRGWAMRLGKVSLQEGVEILEGVREAVLIRSQISEIGRGKNIGIGEFSASISTNPDIPDEVIEISGDRLIGVSGAHAYGDTLDLPMELARVFQVQDPDAATHSEVKIFEEIAQRLIANGAELTTIENADGTVRQVYANVTGKVEIFSERKPCPSCANLIMELWKDKFPGVEIEKVIHGPRFLPSKTSDLDNPRDYFDSLLRYSEKP